MGNTPVSRPWQCSAHICSVTLDITVGLRNSSCVLCSYLKYLHAYLSICLCVSVSVSLLVCGLPLVVEACLAFVWGRLEILGSQHSLEQPRFLIPWGNNSKPWSPKPLLSPRRMEPQLPTKITQSLMSLYWLSFLPWPTSLFPDYASRNIFPNTILAPKSLSLDTRTSTGVQTHTAWILFWEPVFFFGNSFIEM